MKIKELIDTLKRFPENTMVVIEHEKDVGWHSIGNIELVDGEDDDKLVSINFDN